MPLIVNGSSNVWWVKQKVRATNEIRDVKILIVNGVEVWREPQEISQQVAITTSSIPIVDSDGMKWYSGSTTVNIGQYRKKVTVSGIVFGGSPSFSYNEKTGDVNISVRSNRGNSKVMCTLKYYT